MPEDRECSLSELSAIIKLSGSIQIAGYKKLNIKVIT
ncbi:MAG: sporulation regulator WhiA, partial [Peptostreptococcaceae bacterium]|nr:sporulation regulator WhiA [Peptostreptococcaceae bacterium]